MREMYATTLVNREIFKARAALRDLLLQARQIRSRVTKAKVDAERDVKGNCPHCLLGNIARVSSHSARATSLAGR